MPLRVQNNLSVEIRGFSKIMFLCLYRQRGRSHTQDCSLFLELEIIKAWKPFSQIEIILETYQQKFSGYRIKNISLA